MHVIEFHMYVGSIALQQGWLSAESALLTHCKLSAVKKSGLSLGQTYGSTAGQELSHKQVLQE